MFVLRYHIAALLVAFAASVLLGAVMVPLLGKLKARQMVRTDGPKSHLAKTGTPTMGGIFIVAALAFTAVFYVGKHPAIIPVLIATVGFGLIGFIDDFIKVMSKRSLGLRAWQKMLCQVGVTAALAYYMAEAAGMPLAMKLPFAEGRYLDFGFWNIPILFFVVIATVNGSNFTDGLDGLLSGVTTLVAVFFAVVSVATDAGISPIAAAVAGALLGFLIYNAHPARVFMGDTGSMALGGFVAASAYMTGMQLFIPIVGLVYLVEVASVMIQVGYFKASGGKRVFRMAPIHHHFELCGWKETRVVAVFVIITAGLCLIGLLGAW